MTTPPAAGASLPYHAIFDILSRTPVKSICRFRCVSRGWLHLLSNNPVFAAAHRRRHGPLLVDSGSFHEEEPPGGRDLRLLDMHGHVVRVIKSAGGFGMMCNTSVDGLLCVNGASSCDGVQVVDPATGEVLARSPQLDVVDHGAFPFVATRYYNMFGFGRAAVSGEYKLIRLVDDGSCQAFTLEPGGPRGWRKVQTPPIHFRSNRNFPVAIDGILYFLEEAKHQHDDSLHCFDLESERWMPGVIQGPRKSYGEKKWRDTLALRITELNGALCMVQSVCEDMYTAKLPSDPFTNIWIMDTSNSDKTNRWIKAYTILMAPSTYRYMPLWVMHDRKLLLQCSFTKRDGGNRERLLKLQIYDPLTDTCADVTGAPIDLAGRIGLCSFHLDHRMSSNNMLALFLDQALLSFSN